MPVPPFLVGVLGSRANGVPNIADSSSATSVAIARRMLEELELDRHSELDPQQAGRMLESGVETFVREGLAQLAPDRPWIVSRRRVISDFDQYMHLATLQALIDQDGTRTLSVEIGRDYLIRPDVTVGLERGWDHPLLHASISCKWTIRSDRVQNIRHEGIVLTRHRRGRQPHIVTVTVEPLPTRLAAIARGTGEVDAVYHLMFDELTAATAYAGTVEQQIVLDELVSQRRLLSFDQLLPTLAV